jgi:outer membrane protein assembly factor BamB
MVSDNGIATCVDARTGKAHWTERLGGGGVSASPVYADGKIYFQNEDGMGFVVKSGTKFEMLSRNDIGARTLASPAIANGALFIRTETELYRIGSSAAKAKP